MNALEKRGNTRSKSNVVLLVGAFVAAGLVMLVLAAASAQWQWTVHGPVLIVAILLCALGVVTVQLTENSNRVRQDNTTIRESEAMYRLLADNASDMVFVLNRQLQRRYVSPASLELLGYGPEELVDTMPIQMIHPDDAERLDRIYRDMLAGLERAQATNRIRHRDGHWVWVEASLRLIRDRTGQPFEICGSLRDITQSKLAQAAQQRAETSFQLLADHSNDVITRAGRDGALSYVSPSAARVIGVPCASLIGKRTLDFVHKEDRPAMLARIERLRTGLVEKTSPVFRIVRADGSVVWLEASSHVVLDPMTEQPDGYVSVLRDVTERVGSETTTVAEAH